MSAPALAAPSVRAYISYMDRGQKALREVLRRAPCSMRALAIEAGLSEGLLRFVRDGGRRLTPETRDALVAALRRWESRCGDLADLLEAADLTKGGRDV